MRRLTMSKPEVVPDNALPFSVLFDVPPQGVARIGEGDASQLAKLGDEVRKRLVCPAQLSVLPHRVGNRCCVSVHISDPTGKALDLLITVAGNTVWPDDNEYARGVRWYINVSDATDMMWLLKAIEQVTGEKG
ncbi:hypothetical protein L0Y23_18425 [Pectobacterium aroidearum]|uniref:Uncharacterized protein n=2 Tax=Pectobacteriaceae TaxID=1903410 RepID=A0AAE9NR21_9GAMM|nr:MULTISPECIES: hypothetical protein [Pectobacterium]UUE35793.1 hypothetical protein L0Y26_19415 [Pectobacterium aroidearum]UUE40168.1 hypothetical protein L0Y25_19420 [Pectobacterium aroidearum]UUE44497.1 hypothetical protein L0Y28_18545 [Pectobacterium aroidearum]UUE48717.1 hypothetical protein L0Y23_18425 [Pectobacterium aroidearum]UUE52921.1 hypothetical protein L0Y30_18545 [Pectobacterium aroidearum]